MKKKFLWILALAPIFYIASYFVRDRIPFHADTAWNIYAIQRWFWNQVTNGEWPLWNEYLFNGYSYFGSPTHEVFSPLVTPFYLLLPSFWAVIATLTAALMLGMFGAYKFTRLFIKQDSLCIAMGIAYGFLGPVLSVLDRSTLLCSLAFYPWIAFVTYQMIKQPTLARSVLWAVLVAATVHHLDWAGTVAAIGLSLTTALFAPALYRWRMLGGIGIGLVLAFLLSAAVLLPVYENLSFTTRASGLSYERNSEWSLNPIRLVQQIIPEIWGSAYDKTFWGQQVITGKTLTRRFWFHSLYLSIPLLLLTFIGLWQQRKKPITWAFVGVSVFLFLLSLGPNFFLHPWMFENISALTKFRYPEKFVLFPVFILLGFSIRALSSYATAQRLWMIRFWSITAAVHLLAPIALLVFLPPDFFEKTRPAMISAIEIARYEHIFLALIALTIVFLYRRINQLNLNIALGIFVALDLLMFSPALKTVSYSTYTDHVRLTDDAGLASSKGRWIIDAFALLESDGRQILVKDWGPLSNFRILTAYDAIFPSRLPSLTDIYANLPNWADVLNLEYLLTAEAHDYKNLTHWENKNHLHRSYFDKQEQSVALKIARPAKEFSFAFETLLVANQEEALVKINNSASIENKVILESTDTPPQIQNQLQQNDRESTATIEVVAHTNNDRKILLKTIKPGWLIFRQSYHSGWQALVNGQNTPIFHGNYSSMAIPIEKTNVDNNEPTPIELKFSSPAWTLGLYLTLLGIILSLFILIKFKHSPADELYR